VLHCLCLRVLVNGGAAEPTRFPSAPPRAAHAAATAAHSFLACARETTSARTKHKGTLWTARAAQRGHQGQGAQGGEMPVGLVHPVSACGILGAASGRTVSSSVRGFWCSAPDSQTRAPVADKKRATEQREKGGR
jgi:hypothetical protein